MRPVGILAALAIMVSPVAAAQQPATTVVTFDADSDELTAAAKASLTAFANAYDRARAPNVAVDAHATLAESPEGSAGYARGLSQRRGNEVRSFLWEKGVPIGSITVAAYAADRPLPGRAPGHAANRRVEVRVE